MLSPFLFQAKEEASGSGESDGDDIEAAIAKEVQTLKDTAAKGERRFQNSQTGAKNCIFIKTTLDDPAGLAHEIFTDLLRTRVQKCRYALRLLPVVGTCKANLKDINELAKVVLQPFFTETKLEVTYTISFKARNNNGVGREMTISSLRNTITEAFPSVLLRYTPVNPQITILVEVMCGVACIAVAKEFARFRKYNLVEVVNEKQTHAATNIKAKGITENEGVLPEKTEDVAAVEEESGCQQQEKQTEIIDKVDSCDEDNDPISTTVKEAEKEHKTAISSEVESSCIVPSAADHDDTGKLEAPQEVCGCTTKAMAQDADVSPQEEMLDCTAKMVAHETGEVEHETGEATSPPMEGEHD